MDNNEQSAIEEEFSKSWDQIEEFYEGMSQYFPEMDWFKRKVLILISELRERGYDRQLRAGQMVWSLILSRARKHGLRQGQFRLLIHFKKNGGMVVTYGDDNENPETKIDSDVLSPELEVLLERLVAHPID